MIGAIVYQLRAVKPARIPSVHGNLLHGLLFHLLQQYSPELSAFVHEKLNIKPFTTALLQWIGKRPPRDVAGDYIIVQGDRCLWRVSALHESLLQPLLNWNNGEEIRIGTAQFAIEKVITNPEENNESGILDENELIAACLRIPELRSITFRFISPVSFRFFQEDLPLPKPEYIFCSIADKWNQVAMPILLNKEEIRELALKCHLVQWEGKSCKTFFNPKHGINGFTGTFTYDVSGIDLQSRQLLLLLAQFSVFSGVGRLTGQGMGQARVTYR